MKIDAIIRAATAVAGDAAVGSQDAAGVIRAGRELGLGGYTNTSYPRGLAALIDDEPERYAVIDADTNSIKFHIAERDPGGRWRTVIDRAELARPDWRARKDESGHWREAITLP